ncbi:14577_t:CDS:1, partial [Gigaspora rosea]
NEASVLAASVLAANRKNKGEKFITMLTIICILFPSPNAWGY